MTATAPPKVTPARRRLLRSLPGYDPYKLAGDCWFDSDAGDRVVRFFSGCLKHVKGPMGGKKFVLEGWQEAVVLNLFGWKRPDGSRRFRECLIYVAKKNGKTAWMAGVLLFMLGFDGEPGAEVFSAASSREQASLAFSHAAGRALDDAWARGAQRVGPQPVAAEHGAVGVRLGRACRTAQAARAQDRSTGGVEGGARLVRREPQ